MERQPSEECTEGAKTHVQKALLGHRLLWQTLSLCSQPGGGERKKKRKIWEFLTLKVPSYPHAFLVNTAGRNFILYNIKQQAVLCEHTFYV